MKFSLSTDKKNALVTFGIIFNIKLKGGQIGVNGELLMVVIMVDRPQCEAASATAFITNSSQPTFFFVLHFHLDKAINVIKIYFGELKSRLLIISPFIRPTRLQWPEAFWRYPPNSDSHRCAFSSAELQPNLSAQKILLILYFASEENSWVN
jgi:hypothetical protein